MSKNISFGKKILALLCNYCPFCWYARNNPNNWFGKLMIKHGEYCPFWKAWKEFYEEDESSKDAKN